MHSMMDWDDLRFFLTLAREGTVSGAAEVLGVAHTTVSRRVSGLEARLGCRLFERLPSGYRLTADGQEVLAYVETMETSSLELSRKITGRDRAPGGKVRLTIPDSVLIPLLLPELDSFRRRHDRIVLDLRVSDDVGSLARHDADIAVRLTEKSDATLVGRNMATLWYAVYATPRTEVPKHWIGWSHESQLPRRFQKLFPDMPVSCTVDSMTAKLAAVKAGLGAAELPCFIADRDTALRRLTDPAPAAGWDLWILTHRDLRRTARIRAVLDFLYDTFSKKIPLIQGEEYRQP
jgi:DNA-binding transcriptional LysR family regulator